MLLQRSLTTQRYPKSGILLQPCFLKESQTGHLLQAMGLNIFLPLRLRQRKIVKFVHLRRQRRPRRTWPRWQEMAPGQLSALKSALATTSADSEKAVAIAGRGAARQQGRVRFTPFYTFLSTRSGSHADAADRDTRTTLTGGLRLQEGRGHGGG